MVKLIIFIIVILALIIFCVTRTISTSSISRGQRIIIYIGIMFLIAIC
jgi:hypothetical protein